MRKIFFAAAVAGIAAAFAFLALGGGKPMTVAESCAREYPDDYTGRQLCERAATAQEVQGMLADRADRNADAQRAAGIR